MRSRGTLAGSIALSAAWIVLGAMLLAFLYIGLALWVDAWRFHPELAELTSVGVCMIALLGSLVFLHGGRSGPREDSDHDDDDEGGQPPPSPDPAPRGPSGGIAPDWESFDRVRADWDRVPVAR